MGTLSKLLEYPHDSIDAEIKGGCRDALISGMNHRPKVKSGWELHRQIAVGLDAQLRETLIAIGRYRFTFDTKTTD